MKINILSVGSFKAKDNYKELFDDYKKRLKWEINLVEIKNSKAEDVEVRKNQEHKEILKYIKPKNKLVVLDERGKIISTPDFKDICVKYMESGYDIDFVVGGSDGLIEEMRNRADFVLSFGKMVFPHLMVRVMLVEQLYRVYSIMNNHPYHK